MSSMTLGKGEGNAGLAWPYEGDEIWRRVRQNYSPASGGWTQRQFCRVKPLLVSSDPKNILVFLGTMAASLRDGPQ